MRISHSWVRHGRCLVASLSLVLPELAVAQSPETSPSVASADSVTIIPGAHYKAGGLHRFFFGGTYRDLWVTPIRVPVLDLRTFAGGLRPVKAGGGHQTKSLHLMSKDGIAYVFRSVDKDDVTVPEMWQGTVVHGVAMDAASNAHPAGTLVAASVLSAAGVLHVTPVFVVMPDDSLLGGFRKVFAGRLGALEEDPSGPKRGRPGFAGAIEVIDSDSLLARIDRDPTQQVDARAFLTARLVDMLLNDWDRGPSQWKWARFGNGGDVSWVPLPRDRDNALISSSGLFPRLAASTTHMGLAFGLTYGTIANLTVNSVLLDGRLLGGLEKPVWDSIALALVGRITDSVVAAAVGMMPHEFRSTAPALAEDLRQRRNALPALASTFYGFLANVVDIDATDRADRAIITRMDASRVDVLLQAGDGTPYYHRRFDARETREIRVYLHGGDDRAVILGDVSRSIPVRIIGGNGTNTLVDSSRVDGRGQTAHLYDTGIVTDVSYGPDTLFKRRPQVHIPGGLIDPIRDYGARTGPTVGVSINRDFGIVPRLGVAHYQYGFDHYPYSSMWAADARYSLKLSRYKFGITTDSRLENSPVHFTTLGWMSQLELTSFHGYGNSTPGADTSYFGTHQDQWLFRPAIALMLSATSDLSFGPFVQYSATDRTPGSFVADSQPYGVGASGRFGEAGVRLSMHHDNRTARHHAHEGVVLDMGASAFPAVWDVTSAFAEIDAAVGWYLTLPVPTDPTLGLRGGGKKLFGDFPFQDAAFIGGTTSIRTLDPQRFAGDASIYATAELRIPVAKLTVLLPLDFGVFGTINYGRVFFDGASTGGWHNAYGGGIWVGFREMTADLRLMRADEVGRSGLSVRLALPTGPMQ